MISIRWLHLTDFHQGMGSQKWLWPGMRERVFEDLARLQEKIGGPWDLVLFTGDLTQRGSAEEFQAFEDNLDRLWAHLQELGSNPRLLAVPGWKRSSDNAGIRSRGARASAGSDPSFRITFEQDHLLARREVLN